MAREQTRLKSEPSPCSSHLDTLLRDIHSYDQVHLSRDCGFRHDSSLKFHASQLLQHPEVLNPLHPQFIRYWIIPANSLLNSFPKINFQISQDWGKFSRQIKDGMVFAKNDSSGQLFGNKGIELLHVSFKDLGSSRQSPAEFVTEMKSWDKHFKSIH